MDDESEQTDASDTEMAEDSTFTEASDGATDDSSESHRHKVSIEHMYACPPFTHITYAKAFLDDEAEEVSTPEESRWETADTTSKEESNGENEGSNATGDFSELCNPPGRCI